jgi:hypothetical protein
LVVTYRGIAISRYRPIKRSEGSASFLGPMARRLRRGPQVFANAPAKKQVRRDPLNILCDRAIIGDRGGPRVERPDSPAHGHSMI